LAGIELLAAKSMQKLLRILCLGEAKNVEPLTIKDRVAATAQAQSIAELMNLFIPAALAKTRWQRHLIMPATIMLAGDSSPFRRIPSPWSLV
jgi:hypothetical protein